MISYNQADDEIVISDERSLTFDKLYTALTEGEALVQWKKKPKADSDEALKLLENTVLSALMTKSHDNSFTIHCNVRLLENASIRDSKVHVTILGEMFQIHQSCSLTLGKVDSNGRAYDGCHLVMPTPALAYGFGENDLENDATHSGDLFLYDCLVDIDCFWGFFRGPDQHVEIINCNINGFGRIEGTRSIMRDVYFQDSHSRWGIISPKGQLKEYSNVSSGRSDGASVYFNPVLADDMRIVGGRFENYAELVYAEDSPLRDNNKTIRFVDADIPSKNYKMKYAKNTAIEIAYSFKPTLYDHAGDILPNLPYCIMDKYGEVALSETDDYGNIDEELVVYRDTFDKDGEYLGPFAVVLFCMNIDTGEREPIKLTLHHDSPWVDVPLFVPPKTEVRIEYVEGTGGNVIDENWEWGDALNPIDPNAREVVYINGPGDAPNNEMKNYIKGLLPVEDLPKIPVYTDVTRDAYDLRPSYDQIMKLCVTGKIKKIITWEPETFGVSRKKLTNELLDLIGVEIIYVKPTL